MRAGPIEGVTRATCPSGTLADGPSRRSTRIGNDSRSATTVRDSGAMRIVTSRVSPDGSIQSPPSVLRYTFLAEYHPTAAGVTRRPA